VSTKRLDLLRALGGRSRARSCAIFEVVVGTAAVAWLLERSAQHEGREGLEGLGS
jgi:hypothetical protein